ncbi:PKS-NRPS hybrid synthetase cheA-like [Lycium barbarum]|uniref:PKS-NRPS hybrid synthetase cheA-like n=1 Tax=Lycium barbarum TaxID=112863 RepID=UPI00293EF07E|nr:PKS-NRPS hybrid synthetase cheA-like [Lycium barbarum]
MKLRNPGTVANIKWTADNKFKYAFFAYGASIEGWKHCRPVVMVDATFLKSKYRGVLMIAVAKDGNNSIFPLAFGIADSENNESYRWFFRHVKKVFGTRKDLLILSDRHSSIATAIKELYPNTQHGICIYHMEKNLQKYFPSEAILSLFYNAATTYKQAEFRTYMSQIQQIDPKAAEYIEEEPPERWARSFHTNRRYNMLTTNNVETMNYVLRKARELPIMACIDYIQNKLQN